MTVHTVSLCVSDISYVCSSSCDLRRIRTIREGLDSEVDQVSDHVGVINNDFHRLLFTKILKFFEHLVSRSEVQVTLHLGVIKAHAHQHVLSVSSVFLVKEMRVCRSTDRHTIIVCGLYKQFVDDPDIILIDRSGSRIRFGRILSG